MIPDKCPKCGADRDHVRSTIINGFYACGSLWIGDSVDQEPDCIKTERDQLTAENKKLRELGGKLRNLAEHIGFTSSDDSRVIENAEKSSKAWDAYIARIEGRPE